jgi:hypothetical protein
MLKANKLERLSFWNFLKFANYLKALGNFRNAWSDTNALASSTKNSNL